MSAKKNARTPLAKKAVSKSPKAAQAAAEEYAEKRDGESFNFNIEGSVDGIKQSIVNHLKYSLARDVNSATKRDWWIATSRAVHDRILERFIETMGRQTESNHRRVYYLSLEYLMGRLLTNNLVNAGLFDATRQALEQLGLDLNELEDEEMDMGLGNGGLGRLAACFLDSMATLEIPAVGYGIHYEFGLFRQEFVDGRQVERADNWVEFGNPWEIMRPEYVQEVRLYGHVETHFDEDGNAHPAWVGGSTVLGIPFDVPICGYGGQTVNFLRLWESRASEQFDFDIFNMGGYTESVQEKIRAETISKVLYPNDSSESGKELRLVQQYFFVACSLRDIIRRFRKQNDNWDKFPEKAALQLNDTHPAIAVSEAMRILVDEERLEWEYAWDIVQRTFAYTNHTLLPEALEKWSVPLFRRVLPRHLEIIYEINRRFLEGDVEAKWPGDDTKKRELSLIEEGNPQMIRMAYLSVVGSHAVNGVAAMHTELLKSRLFPLFHELYPERIRNKTNGITPRRWLKLCNPRLSALTYETIGGGWASNLPKLRKLEEHIDDTEFRRKYMEVKRLNKVDLADLIKDRCGVEVDPEAIFDVQIKRLHEYKRQHLNLLHILTHYRRLLQNPDIDYYPRVFLFAAKAAPGYDLAKRIIFAINRVGERINNDSRINDKMKVVFMPNYGVTMAERIIPAADVSEQISTAGKEASGTGNMKLALNGALTIGTLDGANVEIKEEVGDDNIFIFGMTEEEVEDRRSSGYNPFDIYFHNEELRAVVDWIGSNYFAPDEPGALEPIKHSLLQGGDPFFVLADYAAYLEAQHKIDQAYRDRERWSRMAIYNTARVGKFSSDRTIKQYAEDIWKIDPLPLGKNGG